MADVSGKGLKAAVYTAMTKYILRAYALEGDDPGVVLRKLNEALSSCTPPEVFVTLVYGILDTKRYTFLYPNAGHQQPIYYSQKMGLAILLDVTGPALGLFASAEYADHVIDLTAGDSVLFYTDGITDAGYGVTRLGNENVRKLLETCNDNSAKDMCDTVLCEAIQFSEGNLADDAALLLIRASKR